MPRTPRGADLDEGIAQPKMPKPSPRYLNRLKLPKRGAKPESSSFADSEETSKAASVIQARTRGKKARRSTRFLKSMGINFNSYSKKAVVKIQAAIRGHLVRTHIITSTTAKTIHDVSKGATRNVKERADEALTTMRFGATNQAVAAGLSAGIKAGLAADPWLHPRVGEVLQEVSLAVIKTVSDRAYHAQLEATGQGSSKLRKLLAKELEPKAWPHFPSILGPCLGGPFTWLRAHYLYGIAAADKTISYRIFQKPWMLLLFVSRFLPPMFPLFAVSLLSWSVHVLCLLRVEDEFQLFSYIATFKTYCFVMCGLLPVVADFFLFYIDLSSDDDDDDHLSDAYDSNLEWYNLIVDRWFIAMWVVCWIVYGRYLQIRKKHFREGESNRRLIATDEDSAGLNVHTGDQDTGDHEQSWLMAWDAAVILAHVVFGLLDLYLRIGGTVVEAIFSPTERTMLFESFLITSISLGAAPFVLWKLPVAGELFHQMRPTGFDKQGRVRLLMSLADMKAKKKRVEREKRRVEAFGNSGFGAGVDKLGFGLGWFVDASANITIAANRTRGGEPARESLGAEGSVLAAPAGPRPSSGGDNRRGSVFPLL